MEEQKQTFNWKRLLITTVIVLVAAGVTGGTTYYVLNSNFQKERKSNQKALDESRNQAKEFSEKNDTTAVTKTSQENTSTALKYVNGKYNVELTFPETWKDYAVLETTSRVDTVGWADESNIVFYMPSKTQKVYLEKGDFERYYNSLFNLEVFTLDQWSKVPTEGPRPTEITRNSRYVFAKMRGNGIPDVVGIDDTQISKDIDTIFASFKLK